MELTLRGCLVLFPLALHLLFRRIDDVVVDSLYVKLVPFMAFEEFVIGS